MQEKDVVLKRAICLLCVSDAASLEHPSVDIKNLPTVKSRNEQRQLINNWLKDYGYDCSLTENEKYMLEKEITKEFDWESYNLFYCRESIEPLLWTLSLSEHLSEYSQMSSAPFYEMLNTAESHDMKKLMKKAVTRDIDKIKERREVAMLWHWRTRTPNKINAKEKTKEIFPYLETIVNENFTICDEDFALDNRPFKDLELQQKQLIEKISFWRHYAFEWILGDEEWEDVATTT